MLVHSEAPPYSFENESNLSSAELYRRVMKKYTKLEQLPETNYRASAAPHACFQAGSIIFYLISMAFHDFPMIFH